MTEQLLSLPYRLNSSVTWSQLADGDRLQVRFPDGDHITLEAGGADAIRLLELLTAGTAPTTPSAADEELISLLMQRGMFVSDRHGPSDWLKDIIEYVVSLSNRTHGPAGVTMAMSSTLFLIEGEGWLADVVRDACNLAGLRHTGPDTEEACDVVVIVSDRMEMERFSALNARYCKEGARIVFFWRDVAQIVAGPLVLPGESACFECYRTRLRGNSLFGEEFDAFAALPLRDSERLGSALAEGVVRGFIARQLIAIATGSFDLMEPNALYSFDVLTMALDRQALLRTPRCKACGLHASRPVPAVRAIA
jgi:bacteriocin biosynthesis cyclodehydratase domain-containing protein